MYIDVYDIRSETKIPLTHQRATKDDMHVLQLPRVGDTMIFTKYQYSRPDKLFGKWKVVDVVHEYGEIHYLTYQVSDNMTIKIYVERIQEEE